MDAGAGMKFSGRVAIPREGRQLALLIPPSTITFWEVGTWRQTGAIEREPGPVWSQTFSGDGEWYALAHGEDKVDVWRVSDGAPVVSVRPRGSALYQVAFSPDRRTLAVAYDTVVGLWDMPSGEFLAELRGDAGAMWSVGWSADGKTLASGTQDGAVILWNAATRRRITALPGHTSIVCDLAFSPDDGLLATISVDHELRLLRAPSFADAGPGR
jgi:WD40 repeat protein